MQVNNQAPTPAAKRSAKGKNFNSSRINFSFVKVPALDPGNLSEEAISYLVTEISASMYRVDKHCTVVDRAIAAGMLAEKNQSLIRPTPLDRSGLGHVIKRIENRFANLRKGKVGPTRTQRG